MHQAGDHPAQQVRHSLQLGRADYTVLSYQSAEAVQGDQQLVCLLDSEDIRLGLRSSLTSDDTV